jgi:ComF family protein
LPSRRLLQRLLARLPAVPTQCELCRGWDRERVCGACRARFAPPAARCERCALQVPPPASICGACLAAPPPYDAAITAFDYRHPWDTLIGRFKFHDALDLAAPFSRAVADAWHASGRPRPDRLVPVPLAAARLRERGYNQAWQIARPLARRLGCAAHAGLVRRLKDTPHQLALPPGERAANIRGAFAVERGRLGEVRGQRIAIVDDVMTTGATAAELARVLRDAGAAAVEVWVVARTPAPGP